MLTLADAYLHTLDPFAIEFPRSWPLGGIRWYGLSYAAGSVIGWLALRWLAKSGRSQLEPKQVGDVMFYAIFGVLIGGRLGYVFFYDLPRALDNGVTPLLWEFTSDFPFWGVPAINTGGMSSHGGILGFIIAMVIFARRYSLSSLHLVDLGALLAPAGLFLGRLANFVNAELWGKALPGDYQTIPVEGQIPIHGAPWWSVKYPEEIMMWPPEKLHTLTDLVREVGVSAQQWSDLVNRLPVTGADGQPLTTQQVLSDVVNEIQHNEAATLEAFQPFVSDLTAYYPSQLIQALTDGPILFGALALVWLRPRKPGVVGAWFLMVYGVLRIVSEVFRQPDEGVNLILGLQRGQLLSVLMIVGGAIGLWIVSRRDVEKIGGLVKK